MDPMWQRLLNWGGMTWLIDDTVLTLFQVFSCSHNSSKDKWNYIILNKNGCKIWMFLLYSLEYCNLKEVIKIRQQLPQYSCHLAWSPPAKNSSISLELFLSSCEWHDFNNLLCWSQFRPYQCPNYDPYAQLPTLVTRKGAKLGWTTSKGFLLGALLLFHYYHK
jgi:hypothetical protein